MSNTPKIDIQVPTNPFKSAWGLTKTICMGMMVVPLVYGMWIPAITTEFWFIVAITCAGVLFLMNEIGYDLIRTAERNMTLRLAKGCKDYYSINKQLEKSNEALNHELEETYEEIDSLKKEVCHLNLQ